MPASQPHDSRAANYSEDKVVSVTAGGTANSSAISGYGPTKSLIAQLQVTAKAGTSPTLAVTLQHSVDGTNWFDLVAFTSATDVTAELKTVTTPFADRLRVKAVVGGSATPTFDYNVIIASEVDPT